MNKTLNSKIVYLILFLITSILIPNQYLNKFENILFKTNEHKHSSIIKADTILYIKEAEKIRTDVIGGKNFLESGGSYKFSFLYPRIIYFFNKIVNKNEIMISDNKIGFKNYKLFIYFQIFFFCLSLIFLYKSISKILKKRLSIIIFSVLFFNPLIFQWHLAFLTESLFLSLLIFSISLLLNSRNSLHFFLLGILIGIMYSLRTIAFLYPLIFIIYLLFLKININKKIFYILSLVSGMVIILFLIGAHNYSRANVFYFTPMQSKVDLNTYIEPEILIKSKNFTGFEAREYLNKRYQKILNDNNFDLTKESEKVLFLNEIRSDSINLISENKLIFFKIILKSYFHSMLLNPTQVYFAAKYRVWIDYKNSSDHKFWLKIRFVITPIFFSLFLFGLILSLRTINFQFNTFLLFSILYFFFTSCWLSNTRYFIPSAMFMSVYLSLALDKIYELLAKKKLN